MKALVLRDYDRKPDSILLTEKPIPLLKPGEVLVQIAAASINPSDLVFLQGQYGIVKPLPVVPGFEGSGRVVAAGGGFLAKMLLGKRVACHAPDDGDGTWAEYMVTPADGCIPLFKQTTDEQGAALIVNPMTAWALVDLAKKGGHHAYVQTAAAGALGRMIARLGRRRGLTGLHIVRRPEQVAIMKAEGMERILDSSAPQFPEHLKEACQKFHPSIAFDAVGGAFTRQLAAAMPRGSRLVVYGALSGENCELSPAHLVFRDQKLEGFWLTAWFKKKTLFQKLIFAYQVQRHLSEDLQTHVQSRFPLEQFREAIELYKKNRSEGKVLLIPTSGGR